MKRMRHLFTALLLLCATMSMAHDFEVDGIFYGITDAENHTVAVTFSGNSYSEVADEYTGSVVIPSTVTYEDVTYSVTAVAESAFRDCAGLTYLFIPNSIVNVGNYAFNGCAALRELYIEDGEELLTMGYSYYESNGIGYGQFYECPLETLHLGRNLSYPTDLYSGLSPFCYYNSSALALTNVTIGDCVTSIGYALFRSNTGITDITLPDGVTSIGGDAFLYCEGLTSIVIPSSVTSVGSSAFLYCSKLKTVVNFSNLSFTLGDRFGNGSIGYQADVVVNAPNGFIDGDYIFGNVDGVNILAGYIGSDTELVLPADCNGESYDIGERAFYDNSAITSIVMPDCVTAIGDYAFRGCSALANIELSDNLRSIGAYAFYNCNSLESFTIGDNVESIGENLFSSNTSLKTLHIGSGLRTIGSYAFASCNALETVTIAEGVTSIGKSMFSSCTNLKSLIIPNSVTSIADDAFWGAGLTNIVISDGVKTIGQRAFLQCRSLKSVVIGSGVTTIYNQAFNNCTGLSKIVLGKNVSNIVNEAFYGCSNLKTIVNLSNLSLTSGSTNNGYVAYYVDKIVSVPGGIIDGDYIWSVADGVNTLAAYIGNATELILPANYNGEDYRIGASAFSGNTTLTSVTISDAVTSIGNDAFKGCTALASVSMGCGVASIGNYAFSGCSVLTGIELPDAVKTIGTYVFQNCTKLASISMGSGVTSIGNYAFAGCSSLASITIPNSVTTIGTYAFQNCKALASVSIGNGVTSIGNYAFGGCKALSGITIPDAVTSIASYAFENCTSLASVSIGSGVTSIGNYAFNGCTALKDLRFEDGEGILTLGYKTSSQGLFYDCPLESLYLGRNLSCSSNSSYGPFHSRTALTSLTIGDKVTSIGNYLFYGCSSLASITIPNSVTTIGTYAFQNCKALASVSIGGGVTSIGNYAFSGCSSLASITIPNSVTTIGTYVFQNCSALASVSIGGGVTSIGNYAFNGCTALKDLRFEDGEGTLTLGYKTSSQGLFYDCPLESLYLGRNLSYTSSSSYSPFHSRTALTSLTIVDKVTSIGNYLFYGCSNIAEVIVPSNIASIGTQAFYNCKSLKSVINFSGLTFTAGATTHGYIAYYVDKLINAPGGSIEGDFVFAEIDGVNKLIKYIYSGEYVDDNTELDAWTSTNTAHSSNSSKTYTLDVKYGMVLTFDWKVSSESNYDWLTVTIDGTEILKKSGELSGNYQHTFTSDGTHTLVVKYTKDSSQSKGDDMGKIYNIVVQSLVEDDYELLLPADYKGEEYVIAENAFTGHTGMNSVEIPATVTAIGANAFNGCTGLTVVTSHIAGDNLFAIDENVFSGVDKENCTLYVPWDAIETYASTDGWSSFYEIKKILPAQVVITIGSYGSATYSSPYALDFSDVEGLSAYTATNCNVNNVVITLTKVDIANEATGLLLIGTPGEYTVPVVEDLGETAPNLFVATLKKTAVNSTSQDGEYANFKYTVKSGDTSPKFYRFADGSTLSAGKAYLQLPVSLFPQGASKTISLKFEDGTTDIDDVEGEDCGAAVVYDLQGRVVNNPTKGIYIVNGKKVVIK